MSQFSRSILWSGTALVLLVVMYLILANMPEDHGTEVPAHHNFHVSVSSTKISGLPPIWQVKQGDSITITVDSDITGSVHVHGYDNDATLKPQEAATLKLVAKKAGQFEIEAHFHGLENKMHATLAALEVHPK